MKTVKMVVGGADFFDVVTVNVLQLVINEQLGAGLPLLLL